MYYKILQNNVTEWKISKDTSDKLGIKHNKYKK